MRYLPVFRFTIRDVLWLTVVVGLGVVLWSERATTQKERAALSAEREAVKAKKRELDREFLKLVDAADKLNEQQAALENRNSGR